MHSLSAPSNSNFPDLCLSSHHSTGKATKRTSTSYQQTGKLLNHRKTVQAAPQVGLRTPPADDMGTTYQMPNLASCGNHRAYHSSVPISSLSSGDRPKASLHHVVVCEQPRYLAHCQQQQPIAGQSRTSAVSSTSQPPTSRHSTRPSTPYSEQITTTDQATAARDATMVLHSLQIPPCISPKGGDFADFAAQTTCLFWFESIKTLEAAEDLWSQGVKGTVRRLTENAVPVPNFKKWVQTVLSTTQVTQNVILLALLFIYRLKITNPNVKGRPGSEYRLLTVGLMLGNKFLDDNTYTNKTWAEVSGISVGEIHVMEVEFLSNMRYSLLVSRDQWEDWLVKLAKFWDYCDRAQRPPDSPLAIHSPAHRSDFVSPLPSPTATHPRPTLNLQPVQQLVHTYSPVSKSSQNSAGQSWQNAYHADNAVSPLALKPDLSFRKRTIADADPTEPPAKRVTRQLPQAQPQFQGQIAPEAQRFAPQPPPLQHPVPKAVPDSGRISVPSLGLDTNSVGLSSTVSHSPRGHYGSHQMSALSLPPLVPGVRAMSTVYPGASSVAKQQPLSVTSGSHMATISAPTITPTTAFPPPTYGTPTKRLSPQSSLTPVTAAYGSSPLAESFAPHTLTPVGSMGIASGTHTPISHSPSIYLQQRASPYKPVRHVNTLLYPPPSAFLHEYHLSSGIPPTQMHYQPLGRRNVYRTGIVPEFAAVGPEVYRDARQAFEPMAPGQANSVQPFQGQFGPSFARN